MSRSRSISPKFYIGFDREKSRDRGRENVVIFMTRNLNMEVSQSTGGREILFMTICKNGTKSQEIMSMNAATANTMSLGTRNTMIIPKGC